MHNLVLIVLDSARRDRFGCYGYARSTTPCVDRLATEGLVFERMIAPAPWTVPSHASLFTGLYPREHGAHFPAPVLRSDDATLASHLAAHGYQCVAVSANTLVIEDRRLAAGFAEVVGRSDLEERSRWRRGLRLVAGYRDAGAAAIAGHVIGRVRAWSRPYFLFVNLMECHWDYAPPWPYERRFVRHRTTRVGSVLRHRRLRDASGWEVLTTADAATRALYSDLYDGALAWADRHVGLILEAIERAGDAAQTVVAVLADHGEHLGQGGLADHQASLSQVLIQIPCVVRLPEGRRARISGLVQTTDLAASLCRRMGVPVPGHLVSRPGSVDPFSLAPTAPGRALAFSEWQHWGDEKMASLQARAPSVDFARLPRGLEAVQDRRYKLVRELATGAEALYDLAEDPSEQHDRGQEAFEIAGRLRAGLEQWRGQHPAAAPRVFSPEEEAILDARLRQLGYV
ncbi:MAG: sulfatase [Armatimonadota bacterium]|nr:sulfatase [Armatimonadota bacterium]